MLSLNLLPSTSQQLEDLVCLTNRDDRQPLTITECQRDGHHLNHTGALPRNTDLTFLTLSSQHEAIIWIFSLLNPLLQRARPVCAPLREACAFLRLTSNSPVPSTCLPLLHVFKSVPLPAFFKFVFWYSCLVIQGKTWDQAVLWNTDNFLMI